LSYYIAKARKREATKRAKELYAVGVNMYRIEKRQKAALKKVAVYDLGAAHLTILIPDPSKEQESQEETVLGTIPETILEGFEASDLLK
jgi:hypothetical protein